MGVFEVIFVVLTVAVPAWLWTRTSTEKVKIDWSTWDRNVARLIDSDGGFPGCETLQAVDVFQDLCEASRQHEREGNPLAVERASKQVVFSCLYKKQSMTIHWRLEDNSEGTMDCGDPGGHLVTLGPGATFDQQGRIKTLDYWGENNDRESVPYRNCRVKALRAKTMTSPPADFIGFLQKIGRTDRDPSDFMSANLMCYTFDSSPLWKPWREKYMPKN
jgi:hypothetical protein